MAEALAALQDSAAAEEARLAEANEWSRVDGAGRQWGASPGTLHFGVFDLPYCGGNYSSGDCGLGVPPGKLMETRERRRVDSTINESAFRQSMGKYWADRASKMNARKEEARRAKGRSGG